LKTLQNARRSAGLELASNHASKPQMLPVAKAMQESAAP
jgi:hypothetical protein